MGIRFGLIGCGRIARRHIFTLARSNDVHLAAVSDIMKERMEEASRLYQSYRAETLAQQDELTPPQPYQNFMDMLANPDIDAIIITTLSGLHADITRKALLHNKHVVLEKPMTLSLAEANELAKLADERRRRILVCHQLRYRPIMQEIKRLVDSGALGRIHLGVASIRLYRSPEYYAAAAWRGTWEEDGGMLLNQGIHAVDLLQWWMGDVTQVYGDISRGSAKKETEDIALGILTFADGARGLIEANTITYPNNMGTVLSLFGEKGAISIGGTAFNEIYRWCTLEAGSEERAASLITKEDEHERMYGDFIRVLLSGSGQPLMNGNEGKKALESIFALYASALSRMPVSLPLASFVTTSMKEMKWL
ncbi:Gfo/Idh/MocA family protein [Aneurinibacillus terranovensis]|uniref:Gfo/Idh/MocA family protein n=1 Tax=Aneurinibacillus terranovensis TaxID=278991 RepID=UPI00040AA69B|nr:Gfo/Idh/MocA family oxidoreductase [Aneurinibacillus terranovensis]